LEPLEPLALKAPREMLVAADLRVVVEKRVLRDAVVLVVSADAKERPEPLDL
jgi:hypothetical protein